MPLSARQYRFTPAGKGDKYVSRVNPFVNPFAHPFCSVNPFLAPIKWVNMGLVQPNSTKPPKINQIAIIQENARNFSFLAFSIRFCCKTPFSQRLENCGARRAAFRPYFSMSQLGNHCATRVSRLGLAIYPRIYPQILRCFSRFHQTARFSGQKPSELCSGFLLAYCKSYAHRCQA